VAAGLVASLNRPGGNVTGITSLNTVVTSKRLEMLHELVPASRIIALLVNPATPQPAEATTTDAQATTRTLGLQLHVVTASSPRDIDTAFTTLAQQGAAALVVSSDALFNSRSEQIAALAARHAIPAIYPAREYVAAGGLISYGTSLSDIYRQVGLYTGKILKGEKPAELPVQQSTKVELVINLKTAKTLGLTFPLTLLGRADEVIE
jgi:putative tryptophan/tyrosine transport system substrate-binding protein